MLKKYSDFLLELNLGLGDLGGGDDKKKEPPPDPEKEIAKEKEKKREKAAKERAAILDKAESDLTDALKKTPSDFNEKFKKRILDSLEDDDRVIYHNLILDIQSYEVPMAHDQNTDDISDISPVISTLQMLNKNEYRG